MGQKVNPHGLRVGVIKDWDSKWYADAQFSDYLVEDYNIRKFLKKKLYSAGVSKIEIERAADRVKVVLYTAKPGVVIGRGGAEIEVTKKELSTFVSLLNPFAPHVTEEINEIMGGEMLAVSPWPTYDEAKCVDATIEIVVQINGKVRAKMNIPAEISNEDAIALAKEDERIKEAIDGKTIVKELYVKGRLVNIVVR
jgi:leucyl-tRNA synthetase